METKKKVYLAIAILLTVVMFAMVWNLGNPVKKSDQTLAVYDKTVAVNDAIPTQPRIIHCRYSVYHLINKTKIRGIILPSHEGECVPFFSKVDSEYWEPEKDEDAPIPKNWKEIVKEINRSGRVRTFGVGGWDK